jgi:hypothetical protein
MNSDGWSESMPFFARPRRRRVRDEIEAMAPSSDCEAARRLIPELTLGIAEGRDRVEAVEHVLSCADCRLLLAELSEVSDELLLLAPADDPPVGFESRLLERLGLPPRRRWARARVVMVAVTAALLASAATAAALVLTFRDDRQLAGQYRNALARVGGQYFQAARLYTADGTPAGKVFGYQGEPSWLVLVVYAPYRQDSLTGELITTRGERVAIPGLLLDARRESWGGAIPIDLRTVALVRLRSRTEVLEGNLPPVLQR